MAVIAVDQDQVLCKWIERILEWYNHDKKTSFTLQDMKHWEMEKNLGEHSKDYIRSCMRYPEFYRDLDPVEGAIDGVKKLIDMGHDVVIVTATPKCAGIAYHGKLEWIRRNMPFFNLDNFISASRKYLIDAKYLIDDGIHNIISWTKSGKTGIIFDAPYNKDVTLGNSIRVKHWNEIVKYFNNVFVSYNTHEEIDTAASIITDNMESVNKNIIKDVNCYSKMCWRCDYDNKRNNRYCVHCFVEI